MQPPAGAVNTMVYDPDGLRVRKDDSSGTHKYLWDGQILLLESNADNVTQAVYTHESTPFGGLVSAVRKSGALWLPAYHHYDVLGSTRHLTDAAAQTTDTYLYEAYGAVIQATGTTETPFRWIGKLGYFYDPDLLNYYIRARHYSPALARWLAKDPLEYKAGDSNLYRYVGNSPVRRTDPSGLAGCCGKEIGHMLDEFSLRAHRAFFKKMASDPANALLACTGKDNVAGWDIFDLLHESKYQFSTDGCGTQECRGTVMVHGQCHWASDVNYFLWGLANHLCASAIWRDSKGNPYLVGSHWWTEDYAVDMATLWVLVTVWFGDGTIAGRLAWTRAGYQGKTVVPSTGAASKCPSCRKKAIGALDGHFGERSSLDVHVFI